jgi:hypothetical protein
MYGAHSTGSGSAREQDEIKPNTHRPINNSAGINQNGVAPIFWTEARIADLRERWTAGESASVIAAAFGTTRNAVIGKVRRLDLERRVVKTDARGKNLATAKKSYRIAPKVRPQVQSINRAGAANIPSIEVEDFTQRTVDVASLRKNIVDVGLRTECHYPDKDRNADGHLTFCGHPVSGTSSWCAAHYALAHGKRINITEADRARRRTHATKVWFGASAKLVGNPAEAS